MERVRQRVAEPAQVLDQRRHPLGRRPHLEQRDAGGARPLARLPRRGSSPRSRRRPPSSPRRRSRSRAAGSRPGRRAATRPWRGSSRSGWGSVGEPGEPPVELVDRQRREGRLAGGRGERRQPAADARGQPDRLATVVAGQVRDLEPVEDRELHRLLGGRSAGGARPRRTPGPGRPTRGTRRRARRPCARARTRSRCAGRGRRPRGRRRCWRSTTWGGPSRRASSLGPTGWDGCSASTSRMSAARVTAGASDSGSASRSAVVSVSASVRRPSASSPSRPPVPRVDASASRMDRVQHIDLRVGRSPYCSTYRRSFSMLDGSGGVKRRSRVSRFRSIAPAIGMTLVLAACSAQTPTPTPTTAPTAAPPAAPSRRVVRGAGVTEPAQAAASPGTQVRGRQRQHPDVQRPPGRRAAPAARAGLGVPHRRPRQRRRGRLPDDLRQGPARRVDRHQRLRRLRVQPPVAGRLHRPRLPRRPDRSGQQRRPARLAGHRPVLPRLQRDLQRQGLHDPARRRLPHGLFPQGHPRQGRRRRRRRPGTTTSRSPQKYDGQDLNGDGEPDYGSCIAKKKGAQSYWWIISVAAGLLQGKGTGDGVFFDTST